MKNYRAPNRAASSSSLLSLTAAAAAAAAAGAAPLRPHIVLHIVDDWGHANFGFNRADSPHPEVATPTLDALAEGGLVLDRLYVHKFCSPSRSSIQSGRLPVHVNVINSDITQFNASDPQGGAQGVPEAMTGLGEVMRRGAYRAHFTGKWNAGMASVARSPAGRGYESSLFYFGYKNDYFTEVGGACPLPPPRNSTLQNIVDLFDGLAPARGLNGSAACSQANQTGCAYGKSNSSACR